MRKTITAGLLRKLGACSEAVYEYEKRNVISTAKILHLLIEEKKGDWFLWLTSRLMEGKQSVRWAVFCARRVIEIFEKEHPNIDGPRKAIRAAEAWLKNPSKKTKNAASFAAREACFEFNANYANYAAHYSAHYAARAAYFAAYGAAYGTAYFNSAFYAACSSAAYNAACSSAGLQRGALYDDAFDAMRSRCFKKARSLLVTR